jgi:hypothetical protein
MTQAKRRRGGQPKPANERKRNNLTFRVRDKLRADLTAAAEANQRSVSEEIEHRVEASFVYERVIGDVRDYERRAKAQIDIDTGRASPPGRFITPQEAAAPIPAVTLPPALQEAIRTTVAEALAQYGLLPKKGAA